MTLLLYAVTPADAEPPAGYRALRGSRAAVVHAERDVAPAVDRDALLAFGRAIEAISRRGPALPVRFGTAVADLAELRPWVSEHEIAWEERLAAVAGCCELLLHVDLTTPVDPGRATAGLSGREFLMRRAEVVRARQTVREEIRDVLRPSLKEDRVLTGTGADRMAVLVPEARVPQLRDDLARWANDRSDLELAVTGPWPPFSFCEALT